MINICMSFDYELFFGDNYGTYDEILFEPTKKLLNLLEINDISATFFADVCSVPVSVKFNQLDYVEKFGNQLRDMMAQGQDVQLHIHSHWFNSKFEGGRWKFSQRGYRIHDYDLTKGKEAEKIIKNGIEYLNDVLKKENDSYKCIAFRAGGFSLQPHKKVIQLLYRNGIRIDSSIAPQLMVNGDAHFYNYRHALQHVNWFCSSNAEWWEDDRTSPCLYEVPVATVDKPLISFIVKRLLFPKRIKLDLGRKKGAYISDKKRKKGALNRYFEYLTNYNAISMDAYSADYLYSQIKRFAHKNTMGECNVAIIGHPKLVNDVYLNNLNKFIKMVKNDREIKFISMMEIYSKVIDNSSGR